MSGFSRIPALCALALLWLGLALQPAAASDRSGEKPVLKADSSCSGGVLLTNPAAQRLEQAFVIKQNRKNSGIYYSNRTHYQAEPWPAWQPPAQAETAVTPSDAGPGTGSQAVGGPLEPIYITYAPGGAAASGSVSTQINLSAIIMREAARNNFDPYLVQVLIYHESGYNNYAVSPAGAQGLMQLMPGTGQRLGVTDPFNPYQNVAAGVRYLREQYDAFGDINLALAAYNAGPGAVSAYGGVPPFAETINYVRCIMSEYQAGR